MRQKLTATNAKPNMQVRCTRGYGAGILETGKIYQIEVVVYHAISRSAEYFRNGRVDQGIIVWDPDNNTTHPYIWDFDRFEFV